jgi:uncharacterized protein (DUF1778 family)
VAIQGNAGRPPIQWIASLRSQWRRGYILGAVLPKAEADIAEAERLALSERDSLRVLALLENPPAAPDRLVRAANAGQRCYKCGAA